MSYKFYGGVHPPEFKTLTSDRPIKRALIPRKVTLPLSQNAGSPSDPAVALGDVVKTGQIIATPGGFISSYLHASISGRVTKITHAPSANHPRTLSVTIESVEAPEEIDFKLVPDRDIETLSKTALLEKIKNSGIVGLGGAAFPTHVKLSLPQSKAVDSLIINGSESEPYLTCDHRIMLEKPREVLCGIDIIAKVLGIKNAYIAVEDNKLSGIYALERALAVFNPRLSGACVKLVQLKTKYPQGSERQLVKSILGRIVPASGLPMDIGCVVQNIGTVFAVYEAVYFDKPLIERVVTVAGPCVREPVNIWVRIGTMLSELVEHIGGFTEDPDKIIVGGPMMGFPHYTMEFPITKGIGGLVFLPESQSGTPNERVCIRCGRCLDACPAGLVPAAIVRKTKREDFAGAVGMGAEFCFECGSCAYACPAKIPLLDYMKLAKAKAFDRNRQRKGAK